MSKYYKVDDVSRAIIELPDAENGYSSSYDKAEILNALEHLPTIEVSEDCISKHDIWKIIEDNAYWVRYNENSTEKGMTLTGINQALNECPSVIPTVSEDCVSKAYLEQELEHYILTEREVKTDIDLGWNMAFDRVFEVIENAPSVVPTTEQSSIVRCKDCTHYHASKHYAYCTVINVKGKHPQPNDYCSYAEEK